MLTSSWLRIRCTMLSWSDGSMRSCSIIRTRVSSASLPCHRRADRRHRADLAGLRASLAARRYRASPGAGFAMRNPAYVASNASRARQSSASSRSGVVISGPDSVAIARSTRARSWLR